MVRLRNLPACLFFLGAFVGNMTPLMAEDKVTVEPQTDSLIVKINGEDFTVLHYGESFRKPYFWPIKAKDGTIITRPIDPEEKDHPHHKGVWFSVDEVNDIKFWVERGKIARVRFSRLREMWLRFT